MASDKFSTPTPQPSSVSSATSIGVPVAAGIGSAIYNEWSQREAERRQQKYYEKNVAMNYKFARQAERDSALNQKYGLQNAGLSTALASEGKFSAPALASSPIAGDAKGQKFSLDPLAASQLMTNEAQRRLIEESAREKQIKNDNAEDENATYDTQFRAKIDELLKDPNISEEYKTALMAMKNEEKSYTKGTFDALMAFSNLSPTLQESTLRKANASFQYDILDWKKKFESDKYIAQMDKAQFENLIESTAKARAEILNLSANTALTQAEQNNLKAQAMKAIAEANSIYHGDVAALWANDDWKALIAHYSS